MNMRESLLGDGSVRRQFGAEAPAEFLAEFANVHAGHDDEFAREHFAGLVVIGELAGDAAILAILIPAEAAVGDSFGADELKAAKERVALRHLKFFAENGDVHELFVRAKRFRHGWLCPLRANRAEQTTAGVSLWRYKDRVVRERGADNARLREAWLKRK